MSPNAAMRFGLRLIRKQAMSKPDVGRPWFCRHQVIMVALAWPCSALSQVG
jgi:hypothetical protein